MLMWTNALDAWFILAIAQLNFMAAKDTPDQKMQMDTFWTIFGLFTAAILGGVVFVIARMREIRAAGARDENRLL